MSEKPQKTKNQTLMYFAGLCGILGSILPLVMVVSATFLSPWFSWNVNALSELGVGEQATLFNSAVLVGGLLNLLFAIGLRQNINHERLSLIGASLIMAGSVSLALVGIFTINYLIVHVIVALGYFMLVPIGILLIGKGTKQKAIKTLSIICGIIALFSILVFPILIFSLPFKIGFAVPELMESLAISYWTLPMSIRLIKPFWT